MKSFKQVLLPVLVVVGVVAVVGGVLEGIDGVLGALLGGVVVVLFLGSTPVVLTPLVKASPSLSLPVALGFLATKSLAVLLVLVLLFDVGGIGDRVDAVTFGVSAILASLTWTMLQIRGFGRRRVPTYDLDENH